MNYAKLFTRRKDGRYVATIVQDGKRKYLYDRDPEALFHKLQEAKTMAPLRFGQILEAWKDEHSQTVGYKTASSTRSVPIMIPELAAALKRERQKHGPIMTISQNSLRYGIRKICEANGLPDVGIHGLRHSFASLAYHLQIPEMIAAEIGGWSDTATMHRIYTHIAQEDVDHYKTAMERWYKQSARKNGNEKRQ